MELGNSHKSCANQRPWPPGPPMRALGQDQIGPILELISPLFLAQKGPKWSQILCRDPEHDPSVLRLACGGHFGAIWGNTKRKNAHSKSFLGRSECVLAPFLGPKGPLSYTGAVCRTLLD